MFVFGLFVCFFGCSFLFFMIRLLPLRSLRGRLVLPVTTYGVGVRATASKDSKMRPVVLGLLLACVWLVRLAGASGWCVWLVRLAGACGWCVCGSTYG